MKNEIIEVSEEILQNKIYIIRGKKVMFDRDLAMLYGVETKTLKRAVNRNLKRFPPDFMFQLSYMEIDKSSRYQFGTLNEDERSRSQTATLKRGQNIKYMPYVFTEQGVAMLSSVLHSDRAISVNIQIMRMFSKFKEILLNNEELKNKVEELEREQKEKFKTTFNILELLLREDNKPKRKLGFSTK